MQKVTESDEALIEAVKDYPCLYNNALQDFRMVDKKENAWKAVATRLDRSGMYFTQFFVLAPSCG